MTLLFAAAMFTNALLLFFVQPMFAKLLLPLFGGSPAVWTTCMLFFQSALLGGYFYSHLLVKLRRPWQQAVVHGVVIGIPILTLPIAVSATAAMTGTPISSVLRLSTISVGAPFFVLATSAPLLQRWFASATNGRSDPYFLYAASNVGSFASLMLYPTLVEPTLALSTQTRIWSIGYGIALVLTLTCAIVMWRRATGTSPADDSAAVDAPVTATRRLRWIALAFVPSSLMLAVTQYLSTDVAAVPLLWVLPLALYLITFVVTFGTHATRAVKACWRNFPIVILVVTFLLVGEMRLPIVAMAAAHLGAFLVMAMLCHGTLAADRPRTSHLTDFYLSLAIGGALGGVFNTLVAPVIFKSVLEYPIVLGAGILLVTFTSRTSTIPPTPRHWIRPVLAAVLAAIAYKLPVDTGTKVTIVWIVLGAGIVTAFSLSREPRRFGLTLAGMLLVFMAMGGRGYANVVQASRTFFGTYRVSTDAQHRSYTLFHGTTIHGRQNIGSHEPLTYYHAAGPIGQVFTTRPADSVKSVAVVGLGTGTLASYVKPGQHWVFYEIDPEVERIARDTRYFTHVSACGSACEIVIGDARLSMQHRDDRYDVIVLDAFSSDAIPIHLLTREAVGLYLSRLRDDGILAVHISNNHLNLVPVLAGAMRAYDLVGRRRVQPPVRELPDLYSSHWAVLARSDAALGPLAADKNWQPLEPREGLVWTDDFSNIWTAIQWRK